MTLIESPYEYYMDCNGRHGCCCHLSPSNMAFKTFVDKGQTNVLSAGGPWTSTGTWFNLCPKIIYSIILWLFDHSWRKKMLFTSDVIAYI
jgi:hypothetical protein